MSHGGKYRYFNMDKEKRKTIEQAFYNYEKNKKEAAEYVADLCSARSPILENLGRGSGIKNPTEIAGIKLAEYKKYLWCEVVERTVTTYRFSYEYIIIKRKYFDKKPRRSIIAECVSERTYQRWLSQILETAEQWAETLGVL